MRLGIIGPSKGNLAMLRERAEFVLGALQVDRAVYMGVDGALDEVVSRWASELVGGDPSDDAVWTRGAQQCARAAPDGIDAFLEAERKRQRLKALECLPHANARSIELFETVFAVLIYDKALLDEEDILPASVLVFGRSPDPVIHRIGQRTFVCPGPSTHASGGVMMLDDEDGVVTASLYGPDGRRTKREVVAQRGQGARVTVQGAGG